MKNSMVNVVRLFGNRLLEKLELDMGVLNVFIGSNGAGKTNLISLFFFLQAIIEGRLQPYIAKHGGSDAFFALGQTKN